MLGIAELPFDVIGMKLKVSQPSDLQVIDWAEPLPHTRHVWSDGSVQLSHHPWLTLASFAVVAEDEQLLVAGRVCHWRLSSYSAELWAVLAAFAIAEQPLVVRTDSLTVVNQFNELLRLGSVQVEWTHTNWWGFLLTLIHQRRRRGYCDVPLQLVWCPAHLLEHIPADLLTEVEANAAGSCKRDILLNRLADDCAKQQIAKLAVHIKADLRMKETDVFARQLWLAKINRACKRSEVASPVVPPPARAGHGTFRLIFILGRYTVMYRWPLQVDPICRVRPFEFSFSLAIPFAGD